MALKPTTGLETHPIGTAGLNAIINANWERLEALFLPLATTPTPGAQVVWNATNKTLEWAVGGALSYERHVQIAATLNGAPADQPSSVAFGTVHGLQFPTSGTKYAYLQFEVPEDWDGTDMVLEIDWFPDSGATSGTDTVKWTCDYRSIAEGESNQTGTIASVSSTDSAAYAQYVSKHARHTIAFDHADQPLVIGNHVYVRVTRDTAVANDFAGTVTVAAFELVYQSNAIPTT